jgi:hypothetical protein
MDNKKIKDNTNKVDQQYRHMDLPPHILRELLDLREKVGKLEGMMQVILEQLKND